MGGRSRPDSALQPASGRSRLNASSVRRTANAEITTAEIDARFLSRGRCRVDLGRCARSEAEVDEYLRSDFTREFGVVIDHRDAPESAAFATAQRIEELLDGFSWSARFLPAAVAAANVAGWHRANCAFVFLNFRYPADGAQSGRQVSFLGTFSIAEKQ